MSDAVMVPSSWVKILRLIAEGHPVEAHEDQFIVVQNPDFQPDMNDPNFVIDTHALAASTPVGGWLVERAVSTTPNWWSLKHKWTGDASKAIRFSREIDADAFIDFHCLGPVAKATEHQWEAPPPPSVSTGSRPQEAVPTEQAEPAVVDDRLHDAIRQLRQHKTTIQAAKVASAAGQPQGMGPIWNLVNALPAIVRQLDAAELDIEAAFERYEDAATHHPSRKDRGGLDG